MQSQPRCVLIVSPGDDVCALYDCALTTAGFAVITSATVPTEPIDADAIVVHLHPSANACDIRTRLRCCAPRAVLIALTSIVPDTETPVFETELLLPVAPESLVKIVSALNRAST